MAGQASFGSVLERLLRYREMDGNALSQAAKIPEADVRAVLGGATPDAAMLRRLAVALDLHAADLFVMAGRPMPADLAPSDPANWTVREAAELALRLRPEQRRRLREFVRSLPQHARTAQPPAPPSPEQFPPGAGGVVVGMLRNRNLNWPSAAKLLFVLGGAGPLSSATIGLIGRGEVELSPELLVGFARVLAVPPEILSAVTGIELPRDSARVDPAAADVAELIWDLRRLSVDQVRDVADMASRELAQRSVPPERTA